ncbi:MAG: hypothetical protein WC924_01080 [Candidatus Gracilibacteria bacterium]
MRRSLLWVSLSILVTVAIVATANLFSPSPIVKNFGTNLVQFDLLPLYNEDADSAAEVGLTIIVPKQSETLSYSSQAEVFRFTLKSAGPYTLRYLTLMAYPEGLKPITSWTIYPLIEDEIDFENPVAVSEKINENLVRFRFSSSVSSAYLVPPGENSFVVVASVLRDGNSDLDPQLTMVFPEQLEKDWNWAWLPGRHSEAWLQLGESLGIEEVAGLPGEALRKR